MFVKKVLSLMICLAVTAGMFIVPPAVQAEGTAWDGTTVDYTWYEGQESPYTISTPAQFAAFGNILNKLDGRDDRFAGKTIRLAADLDLDGKSFRAMGGHVDGGAFEGIFEGQGHIISNLNITQAGLNSEYVALFSRLSNGGAIRNLGLEGVTMDVSDAKRQAALVGIIITGANNTVENCFVRDVNINLTLPLVAWSGRAGGLVADSSSYTDGNSTRIANCYAVNVRFSPKGNISDEFGMGFGHFAGYSEGGTFTNCYSGGVTEKPSDSTLENLEKKVMSFGIFNGVTDSNCYSDCYADDSGFNWQFEYGGFKRGGLKVSTDELKGMTGDAANLGAAFVKAENNFYNYGYPFLKWEEKYLEDSRQPQPTESLTVQNSESTGNQLYSVTLNDLGENVEYRYAAYGKPGAWQDSNIFTNLPSGKYTFEARTKGTADKYPSKAITTGEEITLGDFSVWNGVSADYSWYDGQESPYTISTPAQFAAFGNILNKVGTYADTFKGKTIQLAADLDMGNMPFRAMGGTDVTNNWSGGYLEILEDNAFKGTFDGKGHIISNLNITQLGINSDKAALFVCIKDGGAVRNLGLEGVTVNVPDAKNQAAFAGILIGDTGDTTIENCFVRDVELVINDTNDGKRIGGFVAEVSEWPQPPTYYHKITNCYAVNVAFTGSGRNDWALGAFAGASGGGMLTNCYSGGTLTNTDGFSVEKFGRFGNDAKVNSCYSDNDNKGDTKWPDVYSSQGSKVSTVALKSTVDMGNGFQRIAGTPYNYGYPFLAWEASRAEVVEGSFTMHQTTESLTGEAGVDITPTAFSDTYDAEANSTFDLVFDQDVDLSTVTKEAVTFNDTAADAVTTDSANTRRVRVHLSAMTPLTRGRLKVFGVKNTDGKYLKNMELRFTTAGTGATGDFPVISSFELVENYATPNETPVTQETDPAGKTITAVAGGLYNNTDSANSYTLLLVRYNEKGMMEDIVMNTYELGARASLSEKGTSSAGGSAELKPTSVTITVPADSKGHTVKAFAWETKSMKPLWESFEVCKPIKLLIIGNSITKHSPNPDIGWEHDWGMAATAESKDYVHQLAAKAEKVAPVDLMMVNSYDFEMYFYDFTKFDTSKYQEFFDFEPDIIICTIGANIKNPEPEGNDGVLTDIHFNKDYYKNIIDFFNKSGKAKVIVGTTIFTPEGGEVQTGIKAYADENSIPYVKMNDMEDEKYSAKPYKDQFPANVIEGVLLHPGDAGMAEMANRLWVALEPVMGQCLAER